MVVKFISQPPERSLVDKILNARVNKNVVCFRLLTIFFPRIVEV